jgi:hypothetical protein
VPAVINQNFRAFDTLTVEQIADRFAILTKTILQLKHKGIIPPPDASDDRWHAATIDNIIEEIHRGGLRPSGSLLPYTHVVPRRLTDDTIRRHPGWRHDGHSARIKHPPRSPEFVRAWFKHERHLAAARRHAAQQLTTTPPELVPMASKNTEPAAGQPNPDLSRAVPKVVTRNPASAATNEAPRGPAELVSRMRRRAAVTQAEIARVIRAAKQAGAIKVELRLNDSASVIVRLQPDNSVAPDEEIIL